jgi:Threonine dehydrogenase and related Zn-dependent dehydrogenases
LKNIKKGDFVIVPFTHGCGHCAACLAGFDGDCLNGPKGGNGYQAEYVRYENADWGLVKVPGKPEDYSDEMLNNLLSLADVMATGYHAATSAEVKKGDTVVVMGDGAVGLSGVLSAKLLGAKRIIAMSRHEDRQKLAKEFGATDIIPERGDEAVEKGNGTNRQWC